MTKGHRPSGDAAARQTVGFLIGALIGFAIAARLVMNDPNAAGQNAWAGALVIVIGCGVAGVLIASIAGFWQKRTAPPQVPPTVEAAARQRFRASQEGKQPDPQSKPVGGVQGAEGPNGQP
jgi:hypothetical protein